MLITTLLAASIVIGVSAPLSAQMDVAFGLEHIALGEAIIHSEPALVHILNIGPTGTDGVRTVLPSEPVTWGMQRLENMGDPPGSEVHISAFANSPGIPEIPLSVISVMAMGPETHIHSDFSTSPIHRITVDYYQGKTRLRRDEYPGQIVTIVAPTGPTTFITMGKLVFERTVKS